MESKLPYFPKEFGRFPSDLGERFRGSVFQDPDEILERLDSFLGIA
jgi:hypothetical protein